MNYFFRCCIWYLSALLIGGLAVLYILPILSNGLLAAHVPAQDLFFIERYWMGAIYVFLASALAALPGFFMRTDQPVRRAALTLPLWAPLVYAVLYLALAYR